MTELAPSLLLVLAYLLVPAGVLLLVLRAAPPHAAMVRVAFPLGTVGVPIAMFVLGQSGVVPAPVTFFVAMVGVYWATFAFLLLMLRAPGVTPTAKRADQRISVLYLLGSILWFALIYWSGSALEGLHFSVTSVVRDAGEAACIQQPELICAHLTIVEALHVSAGNLLTVGAPGITPLDEFTRVLALLQMVPVFVVAFVLLHD